jgi:putative two-component system response regulator
MSPDESRGSILVVDDQRANIQYLQRILQRAGFDDVRGTTDPTTVESMLADDPPRLLVLDLHMPVMDGLTLLRRIRAAEPSGSFFPIIVLTADTSVDARRAALSAGATDFLTKPFDAIETVLRIRNLLLARRMHEELQSQNETLERRVAERTRELEEARLETLERLALAAEFRDDATGQHTRRVADISSLIALRLGWSSADVALIWRAAPLHDVGKIGITDQILLKHGPLGADEQARMKDHTLIGAQILSGSHSRTLQLAAEIALTHHEYWNGQGYPRGLAGVEIPESGRIVAVADVFDALTHARPYKPAWPVDRAVAEIARRAGFQFDPRVVEAFLSLPDHAKLVAPDPS